MKKKLLIFPFNGNGLEALDCIDKNYEFIGFVDAPPALGALAITCRYLLHDIGAIHSSWTVFIHCFKNFSRNWSCPCAYPGGTPWWEI